jgi:hypothetical protein
VVALLYQRIQRHHFPCLELAVLVQALEQVQALELA